MRLPEVCGSSHNGLENTTQNMSQALPRRLVENVLAGCTKRGAQGCLLPLFN